MDTIITLHLQLRSHEWFLASCVTVLISWKQPLFLHYNTQTLFFRTATIPAYTTYFSGQSTNTGLSWRPDTGHWAPDPPGRGLESPGSSECSPHHRGPALKTTEADLQWQLRVPAQPSPHPPHRPGHRDVNGVLGNLTTRAFSLLKASNSVFSFIGISYMTQTAQALNMSS